MGNKLYVGNLAYSVRDESLQVAFAQYGTVTSAKVMMDRESGRSKGFGFVEMSSAAEAQAAMNGMNGQPIEGRPVVVNEARPREERPGGGGGGYGGGSRGYLAITQRHLFLCLAAAGPDRDIPLVRAGVRTWKVKDDLVGATIQLGWFNDKDGHIVVEPPGTEERRQIQLIQGGLRVTQDDHNWLEFERVE